MKQSDAKKFVKTFLAKADIEINGKRPWDIQVHDDRFYARVVANHSLGLGEGYMDGWWDCQRVDELIAKLLISKQKQDLGISFNDAVGIFLQKIFNYQTKKRATEVAVKHYSIGNKLYQSMLDPTMNYSCGYWRGAQSLEEAQRNKMKLICAKLLLKPGMTLLDIGCGWGALAKFAAENFGVSVVGVTISDKQKMLAEERCKGLPVEIRLQDYRDLKGEKFDRVASVGMFEHVGYKNYREFMEVAHSSLSSDGLFLLQTIAGNETEVMGDPWLHKYIFPNGMLPSISQMGKAIEGLFIMEDWHNFGPDYDKTLLAWHKNFLQNWPSIEKDYDGRFYRMWEYYLLCCAGGFRARLTQLWQLVLSNAGLKNSFAVRELPQERFQENPANLSNQKVNLGTSLAK